MADLAHLQAVAAQLAARVRDDDPDANLRWLLATLPDPNDRLALHFVQAAATPVDRPWSRLVAWVDEPLVDGHVRLRRAVAECGTLAGSRRHRRLHEPACAECLAAERAYRRMHSKTRAGEEAQSA